MDDPRAISVAMRAITISNSTKVKPDRSQTFVDILCLMTALLSLSLAKCAGCKIGIVGLAIGIGDGVVLRPDDSAGPELAVPPGRDDLAGVVVPVDGQRAGGFEVRRDTESSAVGSA